MIHPPQAEMVMGWMCHLIAYHFNSLSLLFETATEISLSNADSKQQPT